MAPKPKTRLSVIDRRLQNPFGEPSVAIQFKEGGWVPRWFNGAISSDKVWRAKHIKGWELVEPDMLVDLDQIGGFQLDPAGHITRGERGQEVLMRMRTEDYEAISKAKTRENRRLAGNPHAQSAAVAEAVGAKYGEEAAHFVSQQSRFVKVEDSKERIERMETDE